jgi:hypothetical protein
MRSHIYPKQGYNFSEGVLLWARTRHSLASRRISDS